MPSGGGLCARTRGRACGLRRQDWAFRGRARGRAPGLLVRASVRPMAGACGRVTRAIAFDFRYPVCACACLLCARRCAHATKSLSIFSTTCLRARPKKGKSSGCAKAVAAQRSPDVAMLCASRGLAHPSVALRRCAPCARHVPHTGLGRAARYAVLCVEPARLAIRVAHWCFSAS